MSATDNRTYATGKRKTAVARVWMMPGSGQMSWFSNGLLEVAWRRPGMTAGTLRMNR